MSKGGVATLFSRETALLVAAGLSTREATACVGRAAETGATALEQAIADRLIDEDAAYRALADFMGLPFLHGRLDASREARWPEALHAGAAPLASSSRGWTFAFAPRGQLLAQAIAADPPRRSRGLAVTTPSRLERAVSLACAAKIQNAAALSLPRSSPRDSARHAPAPPLFLSIVGLLVATIAGAAFDAGLVSACVGLALSWLFLCNVALRLAAAVSVPAHSPPPRLPDRRLPVYTVLVPLYRESRCAPRIIAALKALDYPRSKLDVKILVEADDDETREALAACDAPPWISVVAAPPGAPRTKPRALNIGLAMARGELLAVFDAEDRPDPRQLRLAAETFARAEERLVCLQARLAIENAEDSWITRLFALEYAALFGVLLPSLAAQRLPVLLGGTSNHFRVEALREIGGWDAWNVTEDADLGLRFFRRGYRVDALDSTTWEEAPHKLVPWLRQRSRWLKGWMQTSFVHLAAPRAPFRERRALPSLCAHALSLGAVLSTMFGPFLFGFAMIEAAGGPVAGPLRPFSLVVWSFAIMLLVAGAAAMFVPVWEGARRAGLRRLAPWIALMPFYQCLATIAAWRAVFELATRPYYWAKTTHGVSRSIAWPRPQPADKARDPAPALGAAE